MSLVLALLGCTKVADWLLSDQEPTPVRDSIPYDDGYYSCFPAGVRVWTPRGQVPVEELEVGDGIYGLVQASPRQGWVSALHEREHDTLLTLHTELGSLKLTPEHPVWSMSAQDWRRAEELQVGERLRGVNGPVELLGVDIRHSPPFPVYDLTVEAAEHSFFAEGLWVHNKEWAYWDSEEQDVDGDGYLEPEDCDDLDATAYPGAPELCDGKDHDCDNEVDEGNVYYMDEDLDAHGAPLSLGKACEAPEGSIPGPGDDCDDTDATVFPEAEELCEGFDNDCDARVDEGGLLYADQDGDGYGDPDQSGTTCELLDSPHALTGEDCDDEDAAVHPGAAEVCDELDRDCDGSPHAEDAEGCTDFLLDADDDGYPDPSLATACLCESNASYGADFEEPDCDDSDSSVHPGAEEICDGRDNNCDGRVDSGC